MKSYIICSTQRSGSTYFCKTMIQTKHFGIPKESLLYHEISDMNRLSIQDKKCKQLPFPKALEHLQQASSTQNGVCGIKLMMSSLERILRDHNLSILKSQSVYNNFMTYFNSPKFIYWLRSNKIKQAISHAYLRKTRIAHATNLEEVKKITEKKKSIQLTMDEIYFDFKYIIAGEAKWKLFFIQNEITPHVFIFEDFLKDKQYVFMELAKILDINYEHFPKNYNEPMKKISSEDQKLIETEFAHFLIKKHDAEILKLYGFDIKKHY